jgi:hypothetical protein
MIEEEWRQFSMAFADTVRPDDPRGRAGRRLAAVGLAAVLAMSLGALVYGALGGSGVAEPNELAPITPSTAPSAFAGGYAGQTWTAVAGPSCALPADHTTSFSVYGYYTGTSDDQKTTGWHAADRGGDAGDGCTGGILSMPVSGNRTAFDPGRFALWSFDFSAKFTDASCTVATYVPSGSDRSVVGGAPAYYYYYGTDYAIGSKTTPLGGYKIDQTTKQHRWVTQESFTVSTGKVAVKLVDAGADDSPATQDEHVAAAQVKLTCKAR